MDVMLHFYFCRSLRVPIICSICWRLTVDAPSSRVPTGSREARAVGPADKVRHSSAWLGGEGRGLEDASTAPQASDSKSDSNSHSGSGASTPDDAAEHALALASHWRADRRVAPFAREFFRLGAEAYALRQPQFLGEYLREWQAFVASLAGAASASAIAAGARALAFSQVANRAFANLDRPQLDRTLATLRELRTDI